MILYCAGWAFASSKKKEYEMQFYHAALIYADDTPFIKKGLRNRLLSYADIELCKGSFEFWLDSQLKEKKLFLDSGAFSALNRGATIDIDKYIEFIKLNQNQIEVYAGLDVIGDYKASNKNQLYMEKHGLKPQPTFHYGSPLDVLEEMSEKYDYLALGGLVPLSGSNKLIPWLDNCWSVLKKHFPIKVHAFGITKQSVLERYPFYSCDSTTAIMGGGMGRVLFFEKNKIKSRSWRELGQKGKNLDCLDGLAKDGSAHLNRRISNIKAMLKFEKYITNVWTKRGIIWGN